MMIRSTLATFTLIALGVGCAGRTEPAPSPSHPASPMAAEAPAPAASTTLNREPHAAGRGAVTGHTSDSVQGGADAAAAGAGAPKPAEGDSSSPPVAYTCLHHPRVMQAEAGDCPLCGMALEPTTSVQTSPLRQRNDTPTEGEASEDDGESAGEGQQQEDAAHDHGGHG